MSGAFSAVGEARAMATLLRAGANFRLGLGDAAELAGQHLARDVQKGFKEGPQSGVHYYGYPRQSSAAGEYPAIQKTVQLNDSIDYQVNGRQSLEFGSTGAFGKSGYNYAVGLHEGNSKIAARPYLTLTVARTQHEIMTLLGETTYHKIVGGG